MIRAKSGDIEFIQEIENSKFNGIIHSIFDKTVNIKCLKTGDIYTLSCCKLDNGPNSIVIDINSFADMKINLGDKVFVEKGILYIGKRIEITINQVKKWECSLPIYPVNEEQLKANLTIMKNHIHHHGIGGGMKKNLQAKGSFEKEVSKMLEKKSHTLLCEIVNNRKSQALQSAVGLIGLGPGLTPSGDDFLTGLLATFNMPNCPCFSFHEFCKQVAASAKLLTNDISYMTLKKSSIGKVRESIISLIYSVVNDSEKELIYSLNNVLNIGSSSGTDIALGILNGLETNIKFRENKKNIFFQEEKYVNQ